MSIFTDQQKLEIGNLTGENFIDSKAPYDLDKRMDDIKTKASSSLFSDEDKLEIGKLVGENFQQPKTSGTLDFSAQPTPEYLKTQQKAANWQGYVSDISGNAPITFTVKDAKTGKQKIVPFEIKSTDSRSFGQNFMESLSRGNADIWRNVADAANAVDEAIDPGKSLNSNPVLKLASQYRKLEEQGDPVKADNWFSQQLHNTANMLPGLAAGYLLQKLAPGAGMAFWSLQGGGDTYRQLVDDGVDPAISLAVSAPIGALYGAIEHLQAEQIGIPGFKTYKEKLYSGLEKIGREGIKKVIKEFGLNILKESTEEGLQQATQVLGEYIAKGANDLAHDTNYISNKFKGESPEYLKDLYSIWQNFYQSIVPMAITSFPFHAWNGAKYIRELNNRAEGKTGTAAPAMNDRTIQPASPSLPTIPFEFNGQTHEIKTMLNPETGEWYGIIPGRENQPLLLNQKYQDQLNQQYGPESQQSTLSNPQDLLAHAKQRLQELGDKNPALLTTQESDELATLSPLDLNKESSIPTLSQLYPSTPDTRPLTPDTSPQPPPTKEERAAVIKDIAEKHTKLEADKKERNYYTSQMNPIAKESVKATLGLDPKDIPLGFSNLFKEAGKDPVKIEQVIDHIEKHLADKTPIPASLSPEKKPTAPIKGTNLPDIKDMSAETIQAELDAWKIDNYPPGIGLSRKQQLKDALENPPQRGTSPTDTRHLTPDTSSSPAPALEQTKRSHHAQPVKVVDLTSTPKDKTTGQINKDLNKADVEDYAKETGQTPYAVQKQADEFDSLLESSADFANHFMEGNRGEQFKSARKAAATLLGLPNTIEIQSPAERAKALPALKEKLSPDNKPTANDQQSTASAIPEDIGVNSELAQEGDTSFDPEEIDRKLRNLAATSKASGITPAQIQPIISRLTRRWNNAPKIQIVRYLTDLPIDLKKALLVGGINPSGMYFGKDGVFIVSDNLESLEHAGFVLLHESVGHYGLSGVFGNNLDPELIRIYNTNREIHDKAKQMIQDGRVNSPARAVEEVISDMAGKFQGWQRLAYAIRKLLRKMGIAKSYGNDQVWDMIANARKYVASGKPDAKIGSANVAQASLPVSLSGVASQAKSDSPRLSPVNDSNISEQEKLLPEGGVKKLGDKILPKGIMAYPDNPGKLVEAIGITHDYAQKKGMPYQPRLGVAYSPVTADEAKTYQSHLKGKSFNFENTIHIADNSGINHGYIQHGEERTETPRNQLPVSKEDFLKIPEVTKAENIDRIDVDGKSGKMYVTYKKRFNGTLFTVEEVREGRGHLALNSIYKEKAESSNPANLAASKMPEVPNVQNDRNMTPPSKNTLLLSPAKSSPDSEIPTTSDQQPATNDHSNPLRLSPKPRYDNPDQLTFLSELDNPQAEEPAPYSPALASSLPSSPRSSLLATPSSSSIEDFGQKIGGARKDYYAQYGGNMQIAKQKDIATSSLSEVFPEPDYQKLIDGGLNPEIAGFIKAMRDVIPNKPRGRKARHYMQRYVDSVTQIRDFSEKLISGERSFERTKELISQNQQLQNKIMDKAELYAAIGLDKNLKDYNIGQGRYSVYAGVKLDSPMEKWIVSKNFQDVANGNTKAEAIANFAKIMKSQSPETKTRGGTSFDVWRMRNSNDLIVGKKIAAGKYVTLQTGFKNSREAFDYIKQNQAALEAQLEKLKEIPDERAATNSDRIGTDYRNGKDVTPDIFQNQFGFKGVEFGNWVEQERRQDDLNNAFDAFMDMANVLNIPPRALSLNGKLGIGFGSRGTGGIHPAKAHYEPDFIAINLTKNNGPGSLAHEWWHALDNYFEMQRGNVGKYMSENAHPWISRDGKTDSTRPEMIEAFKRINAAISSTGLAERSQQLDSTRSKDYWSTTREMTARAFEWWMKDRLAAQDAQNDYLVNFLDENQYAALASADKFPYVNKSEARIISDAFDNFFSTVQTKEEENRVLLLSPAKKHQDNPDQMDFSAKMGIQKTKYSAWPENFPRTVVMTTGTKLTSHADHALAKKGDRDAAARLVEQLAKPEKIQQLAEKYPDAIVVPVHAEERSGRNQIPRKFADYIGALTGLEVNDDIVQTNTVGHTNATAIERFSSRAKFAGTVIPGKHYILVDDFSTQGGSFSELRAFIETEGGIVDQAVALSASSDAQTGYSGDLAIKKETLLALSEKFGYNKLSEFLKEMEIANGNPDALTNSEGKLLLLYSRLDTARDRIIAARLKRQQKTQSPILEKPKAPESQTSDSGKINPDLKLSPASSQPTTDDQRLTTSPIIPQSQKFTFNPEALRTINDEIYKKAVEDKKKYYMELRKNATIASSVAQGTIAGELFSPISTQLKNISPVLKRALGSFEFKIRQTVKNDIESCLPFIEGIRKMDADDQLVMDFARKNADSAKIAELVKKYNLNNEYDAYRKTMDSLHVRAKDVGFDVGYLQEYHPRQIKDKAGFNKFLHGTEYSGDISKAYDEKTKELGRTLTEDEKADIANSVLRGYGPGLKLSTPGNLKQRKIAFITEEFNKYYYDSNTALVQYLDRINNSIETRRFFGKGKMTTDLDIPEVEKSIGAYVRDLVNNRIITEVQENRVSGILQSRFGYVPMGRGFAVLRDLGLLTTMDTVASTITQLQDVSWSVYEAGWRKDLVVKNMIKTAFGKSRITAKDIGVEDVGEEFRSISKLGKILKTVFAANAFTKFDRMGKETLINTVVDKIRREAQSGNFSQRSKERLEATFGPNWKNVVPELAGNEITDNVKLLAFMTLTDYQPVTQSEMTEGYLKNPRARLLYTLKTYTIKQLDVFRRECFSKMSSGNPIAVRAEGFRNLMHIGGLLLISGISTDVLKDFLFGRNPEPEDYVIDNFLRLFGINRYVAWKARQDGWARALSAIALPPTDFIESPFKDADKLYKAIAAGKTEDFQIKDLQTVKNIPMVGKMYYWWFGGGHEKTMKKEQLANPEHKDILRISQRIAGGARPSDLEYKDRLIFAKNRTEIIQRARDHRKNPG